MDDDDVTHTSTERTLASLPSGTDVTVTVHRYDGGPGHTVYVQAAQHGIELNGPAALRRLHDRLLDAEIAGTVVVVPVVNPLAFDHRSYVTPPELDVVNPNLNRIWPGDDQGSFQERLAAELWELVSGADAVVDLHTGTPDMLEHVRFGVNRPAARRLAEAFGTEYLLTDDPSDDDGPPSGTFRAAAARECIPAITAELGNSRQLDAAAAETGVDGVWNVLREVGVLDGEPPADADRTLLSDRPETTVATASGLFEPRPEVGVGGTVEAGEELGHVYAPSSFDCRETVTAAGGGVLYSLLRESVVVAGERLASVARPI